MNVWACAFTSLVCFEMLLNMSGRLASLSNHNRHSLLESGTDSRYGVPGSSRTLCVIFTCLRCFVHGMLVFAFSDVANSALIQCHAWQQPRS